MNMQYAHQTNGPARASLITLAGALVALFLLAGAVFPGPEKAFAARSLPDMSTAESLGQRGPVDLLDGIAGKETTIKGYKKDNKFYQLYQLQNGKTYAFSVEDLATKRTKIYFDRESKGDFSDEHDIVNDKISGAAPQINEEAYGYSKSK